MERNYDEVISDMLIQLDHIERRMAKADKRMDLTIKRMVKAEQRLEKGERRMEVFDKKLDQSIRNLQEFSKAQSQINKYFLGVIKKNGRKS
jgi:hypothetical protein